MRVAIIQSCYIPWKGYFDLVARADHFIILDDVQYSRGGWRNRNRIKTERGLKWLTIPLVHSGTFPARICEMRIDGAAWNASHYSSVEQAYRDSPGWPELRSWLREAHAKATAPTLSAVNETLLRSLCELLRIATPMTQSARYDIRCDNPTERVVRLCQAVGAERYVSGPSARAYIEEERFRAAGIALEYFDYSGYVEYPQPHGPFVHEVSILDAIAGLGANARHALDRTAAGGVSARGETQVCRGGY